ncbi:helix-turn-helix domain-containing protein [Armatimonas sp.]|uniref:TetR/AcrR family transcriptional regulator n=1 Tax=Armatimonas sp. TaxID=1872638 RepID=UPI00286A5264|nr:helix-turn-helix domain-containing protein [Armatimonas sp.]
MKTTRLTSTSRRLSLLQAALDLFSLQGYAGTTTKAIAQRSGVTEAILFRHFPTKEELLQTMVEQFCPRPLFPPTPNDFSAQPIRKVIELILIQYLDVFWANQDFMLMVFTTPKREQAVFEPILAECFMQGMTLYTILQQRSEQGEIKAQIAPTATDVIVTATNGFIQRIFSDPPENWEASRDGFISNLLQILFGGIECSEK